jgi:hypothetical protein
VIKVDRSMLDTGYRVGFTGHRSGFVRDVVESALTRVLSGLRRSAPGAMEVHTSIAEGCDTLCVRLARELGIPVRLLLPLAESDFANDFSPAGWELAAAELVRAREQPGTDSVRLVAGGATRPECYVALAAEMLQAVDLLVAVTDGAPSRGPGGTTWVIERARAMHLPVVLIDATTGAVTSPSSLARVRPPDATRRGPDNGSRTTTAPDAARPPATPRPLFS